MAATFVSTLSRSTKIARRAFTPSIEIVANTNEEVFKFVETNDKIFSKAAMEEWNLHRQTTTILGGDGSRLYCELIAYIELTMF